jgi:hypothetical protein
MPWQTRHELQELRGRAWLPLERRRAQLRDDLVPDRDVDSRVRVSADLLNQL